PRRPRSADLVPRIPRLAGVRFRSGQMRCYAAPLHRRGCSVGVLSAWNAAIRGGILQLRPVDEQSDRSRYRTQPEKPGDGYTLQALRPAGWFGLPADADDSRPLGFRRQLHTVSGQYLRL